MAHRRGQVLDDRVEQPRGAEVARGNAACDREQLAVIGAALERGRDLLVGDRLSLQVALQEDVGDFADLVHQALAIGAGELDLAVGDRDLLEVCACGGALAEGGHVE